jgi:hypothetical protein
MTINYMNQIDTWGVAFFFWQNGVRFWPLKRLCNDPSNQIKGEFAK